MFELLSYSTVNNRDVNDLAPFTFSRLSCIQHRKNDKIVYEQIWQGSVLEWQDQSWSMGVCALLVLGYWLWRLLKDDRVEAGKGAGCSWKLMIWEQLKDSILIRQYFNTFRFLDFLMNKSKIIEVHLAKWFPQFITPEWSNLDAALSNRVRLHNDANWDLWLCQICFRWMEIHYFWWSSMFTKVWEGEGK